MNFIHGIGKQPELLFPLSTIFPKGVRLLFI